MHMCTSRTCTDDRSLYYALNLNDPTCNATLAPFDGSSQPAEAAATAANVAPFSPLSKEHVFPPHAVWVHPDQGDDANPGTFDRPLRTVQAGVDAAAALASPTRNKTVVLRGGNHYLAETLALTKRHSHIR